MRQQSGYSLLELTLVLALVAVLISGVSWGWIQLLDSSHSQEVLSTVTDTVAVVGGTTDEMDSLAGLNTAMVQRWGGFSGAGTDAAGLPTHGFNGNYQIQGSNAAVGTDAAGQGYFFLISGVSSRGCVAMSTALARLSRAQWVFPGAPAIAAGADLGLQAGAATNTQALGQLMNLNVVGNACDLQGRAHVLLYINARHV
jgi:prepilin-type N-terminal cleavage/methylation domain-containing protein